MRDFIDTVTARALGSDSMLSPRLPSLFEPQRTSPMVPPEAVSEAVAPTAHEPVPVEREAATRHGQPVSPPSTVMPVTATAYPLTVAQPRPAIRHPVEDEATPAAPIVRNRERAPEESRPAPSPSRPPPPAQLNPPARTQREAMLDVLSDNEGRSRPDEGSLLVPARSVFRTSSAPAGTGRTGFQAAHAGEAMRSGGSQEPVVHVSIGRLEVRATPAPGKVAQRQDTPRPSALDDYLRQRGKASS